MRKYLFIFAMLLCWGHATTAQTTDNLLNIAGLEPDLSGQTTYYLKNVGTGLHMSYGAMWGTQCIESQAAHPIIVEDNGDGTVAIANFGGYLNSDNLYMDQPKENSKWKLVKVAGYTNQYFLYGSGERVLTSVGNSAGILALETPEGRASQRWIFTHGQDIKDTKMPNANANCPYDVTVAIRGAAFDYADSWEPAANTPASLVEMNPYNQKWENYIANAKWFADCGDRETAEGYNYCGIINGFTDELTVTYKMTLPKGTYHFSFEAFYKYMKVVSVQKQTRPFLGSWSNDGDPVVTTTDNGTMTAKVTFAGQTFNLSRHSDNSIYDNGKAVAAIFRDNDTYKHHGTFYLNSEQEVSIVISKPATTATGSSTSGGGTFSTSQSITTTSYPSQIYIDDFTLLYYGTDEIADEDISHNAMFAAYLNANITELTAGFSQTGLDAFRNTLDNLDINNIDTRGEYYAALSKLNEALKAGKAAQLTNGELYNHSFEAGSSLGWTQAPASDYMDTNVKNGGETGKDGEYRFNAWCKFPVTTPIKQTLTGLKNGLYKLTARIASDSGNKVYIMGNSYHAGKVAEGADKFVEASLLFLVENGTATVGAVGGNNGYYYPVGEWYKVDDFRMEYICDLPHGRLKLALDEAAAVTLDAYGQAVLDLSNYHAMYDNKSLTSDGTTEAAAVRSALQTAAKAQRTANADMTWAITDHSFETRDLTKWDVDITGDTQAAEQDHTTYATIGTDGRYVFNTWDGGVGKPISQTIKGIPNGTYKVTAMVASDAGNQLTLIANDETATVTAADLVYERESSNYTIPAGKVGLFPEVTCTVDNNELTIGVAGVNNCWYKCDDFRLTYLGHKLTLSETGEAGDINDWYTSVNVTRTIKPNTWSTFVVPFDIPASFLKDNGWEVKELSGSTYDEENGHISLTFADATDGIKAGVPYMVRNTTMTSNLESLSMENVVVNTQLKNASTEHIEFIGVYTNGYVPQGAFFISDNTFYCSAEDNSNTMKAFRAYLQPTVPIARSLSYRTDGETGITTEESTEEATVVAIYNLQGVRLDDMQEGVNILQMSDGRVVKVIIK